MFCLAPRQLSPELRLVGLDTADRHTSEVLQTHVLNHQYLCSIRFEIYLDTRERGR
jgi:hypothetical protein